jgi:hypothetical protein
MNRELLEKPFDSSQIKQREGNFGKRLDYIEGHVVLARLNEAFEAEWSFSILEHRILDQTDEVLVVGQLRAGDVVKTQFGSSRITRARESGEPVSLADDFKAAATDSIKKCASLLGVGLHLYNGDKTGRQNTGGRSRGDSDFRNANGGNGNRNGRLSGKQFDYILSLAKDKGITRSELKNKCLSVYRTVPEHLTKTDASSLIQELQAS